MMNWQESGRHRALRDHNTRHGSRGRLQPSHRGGLDESDVIVWDLWRAKRHTDRFLYLIPSASFHRWSILMFLSSITDVVKQKTKNKATPTRRVGLFLRHCTWCSVSIFWDRTPLLLKIDCMENNTHLVRNFLCKCYVRNKDKRMTRKMR